MTDVRQNIVAWAKWAVANRTHFNYSEGAHRMDSIGHAGTLPVTADCSAFVTMCYNWAGAPDPNGNHYNHEGYTGTLLAHGHKITVSQVQAGDVIVYGPGTGWHTAIIVEAGTDPLTISHGQQGDPSYCRVSQDGRHPQTYLRFDTIAVNPIHTPPQPPQAPVSAPKPAPVATPPQTSKHP